MLKTRHVVIASLSVLVLSLLINAVSLLQTVDNGGTGRDSYGVKVEGYRGILETLEALKIPVERSHVPVADRLSVKATYVLLTPDIELLEAEGAYLEEIVHWVKQGGRLVISFDRGHMPLDFRKKFHLENWNFYEAKTNREIRQEPERHKTLDELIRERQERRAREIRELREDFRSLLYRSKLARSEWDVSEQNVIAVDVSHLKTSDESLIAMKPPAPPESPEFLEEPEEETVPETALDAETEPETEPVRTLQIVQFPVDSAEGTGAETVAEEETDASAAEQLVLVVRLPYEAGEIVLVSEPSLWENLSLRDSDNSILLTHLLTENREQVVFDEYYHGLSIRGNPLWLFAQPGYRQVILALLLLTGLWVWRSAVNLGVLRDPQPPPRQSVSTYLEAVSHLLQKTGAHRLQLTELWKAATVWRVAHQLHLPVEKSQQDDVLARLERMDPEQYAEFKTLLQEYDQPRLQQISSDEFLNFLQRSQRCQY